MKKKKFRINLSSEELDLFCTETSPYREKINKEIITEKQSWKQSWKKYKKECWKITKQQSINLLDNYNKRVQTEHIVKYGFGNCMRSEDLYTLDHQISIWYGYKNDISPEIIGNINNLKYILAKHNTMKGTNCIFS